MWTSDLTGQRGSQDCWVNIFSISWLSPHPEPPSFLLAALRISSFPLSSLSSLSCEGHRFSPLPATFPSLFSQQNCCYLRYKTGSDPMICSLLPGAIAKMLPDKRLSAPLVVLPNHGQREGQALGVMTLAHEAAPITSPQEGPGWGEATRRCSWTTAGASSSQPAAWNAKPTGRRSPNPRLPSFQWTRNKRLCKNHSLTMEELMVCKPKYQW